MTDLIMPRSNDKARVLPLLPEQVNAYVRSEYDKSVNTWKIPNNLIRTMARLPRLALTEVDYANSFIFDQGFYCNWPRPGGSGSEDDSVLFPEAGFVDRVTKELVINLVSLLNRSRYSITHHTVIGYTTLSKAVPGASEKELQKRAEAMLLHLVNGKGAPDFEDKLFEDGRPLYTKLQLATMRLAVKLQGDAHTVTDKEFKQLRSLLRADAIRQIDNSIMKGQTTKKRNEYIDAFVNGMLVELTWCIVHFAGLLNKWFTVLKVWDETNKKRDGIDFVAFYNNLVPERIKVRNNKLLGRDGWGNP